MDVPARVAFISGQDNVIQMMECIPEDRNTQQQRGQCYLNGKSDNDVLEPCVLSVFADCIGNKRENYDAENPMPHRQVPKSVKRG